MSSLPKSKKLEKELELANAANAGDPVINEPKDTGRDGVFQIKPVDCLNEFVAVAQYAIDTQLELAGDTKYENEGVVVGIGPGVVDNGTRVPSQLKLGDVVTFLPRNVVTKINGSKFYKNHQISIIQERSLICRLPPIKFEVVDG